MKINEKKGTLIIPYLMRTRVKSSNSQDLRKMKHRKYRIMSCKILGVDQRTISVVTLEYKKYKTNSYIR